MKVLVVDVGGTHVKILASGQRSFANLTPDRILFLEAWCVRLRRLPAIGCLTPYRSAIRDRYSTIDQ